MSSSAVVAAETGLSRLGLTRAIVGQRYELIVDPMNGGAMAFDLEGDLGEWNDISESHPEATRHLWKFYQRWLDAEVR